MNALRMRLFDLDDERLVALLRGLVEWGEDRPYDAPGDSLGGTSAFVVGRIGQAILVELSQDTDAERVFREIVQATDALLGPAMILDMAERARKRGETSKNWATEINFGLLKERCVARLRQATDDGTVWDHANPRDLYSAYHDLADAKEVEGWYKRFSVDPAQLIHYINKWLVTFINPSGTLRLSFPKEADQQDAWRKVPVDHLTTEGRRAYDLYMKNASEMTRRHSLLDREDEEY